MFCIFFEGVGLKLLIGMIAGQKIDRMEKYEEGSAASNKKLENPVPANQGRSPSNSTEVTSPTLSGGLVRQCSVTKMSNGCLCSPTTHAGSFRCRLHRAPSLQRTKSIGTHHHPKSITNSTTTTDDSATVESSQ